MILVLEGSDTDTLTGDNRDEGDKGNHFSPKGSAINIWSVAMSNICVASDEPS